MPGFFGVNNVLASDTVYTTPSANINADFLPAVDNRTSTVYLFSHVGILPAVIEINLSAPAEVNFFGIARHTLGDSGITGLGVEYFDGVTWQPFAAPIITTSNRPILVNVETPVIAQAWRLTITDPLPNNEIGFFMLGLGVVIPRISAPHDFIGYSRQKKIINGANNTAWLGSYSRNENPGLQITLKDYLPEVLDPIQNQIIDFISYSPFFYSYRDDLTSQDFKALLVAEGQPNLSMFKNICLKDWMIKTKVLDG